MSTSQKEENRLEQLIGERILGRNGLCTDAKLSFQSILRKMEKNNESA